MIRIIMRSVVVSMFDSLVATRAYPPLRKIRVDKNQRYGPFYGSIGNELRRLLARPTGEHAVQFR